MLVSICCLLSCYFFYFSAGVDLTLFGISITNNGRISSVDVGQTLACTSTQGGNGIGSWTLPDGSTVQEGDDGVVEGDGSIALNGPLGPGVYRCNIVAGNGDNCVRTLYIFPNTGMYYSECSFLISVSLSSFSYSLFFHLHFHCSFQFQKKCQIPVQDQVILH